IQVPGRAFEVDAEANLFYQVEKFLEGPTAAFAKADEEAPTGLYRIIDIAQGAFPALRCQKAHDISRGDCEVKAVVRDFIVGEVSNFPTHIRMLFTRIINQDRVYVHAEHVMALAC